MIRLLFAVLVLALAPVAVAAQPGAVSTEVFADTPTGRLAGTLLTPAGAGSGDAVLILPGSGPTDRNGNSPAGITAGTYRLLAEALAAQGIASLRIDKRGIGASAAALGREEDLRFDANVVDAAAWLDVLRTRTGARRLFVLGHSEGALTAAMVAARPGLAGVILVSGAGRPAADVIRQQLADAGAPADYRAQADGIMAALRRGETVADVPPAQAALFRPSIQPYLRSWLFLDPAAELARSTVPALVLQGDRDFQTGLEDARRLAASRPGVRLVVLPGVNHVLKAAPEDRTGNAATYADPSLPLGPGVAEAIIGFIRDPAAR